MVRPGNEKCKHGNHYDVLCLECGKDIKEKVKLNAARRRVRRAAKELNW